jgi:ABC-type nitrate/sulfonate/bicarbonate transport system permease component
MTDTTTNAPISVEAEREQVRRAAARRRNRETMQLAFVRVVSLIVVLTIWQIAGAQISPILFTTPWAIAKAAVVMVGSGELWHYLWPSLVTVIYGLSVAVVAGVALGLLLARYRLVDASLDMYITFLYSTPTVALVPLIVLWAGFETLAKSIILFLFAFFPMVINTYQGVKNVDKKLIEVGKVFRCSERRLWSQIIIPGALPFIVVGLRLAVGRALIGMVIADLYTAISGIGYLIVRTASTYQIDKMFVPVVTLGLLGVLMTALLRLAERKVAPWTIANND